MDGWMDVHELEETRGNRGCMKRERNARVGQAKHDVHALSCSTRDQDKRPCRDNDHEESEDVFRARAFYVAGPGSLTRLTERE